MRNSRWVSSKAGFTLVEVMVVILVIAMLLAIAVPCWMRARESGRAKACCVNLREIETAKEQWAMNNHVSALDAPTQQELVTEYIKGQEDRLPLCPSSGHYLINDLTTSPTCDIGDNGTAETFDDHVIL